MIVLGLTGSIGMGKSTVAKMLKILGVPVHDSDKAVHDAMAIDGHAYNDVIALFPEALNKETATVDRKKLGSIVFSDPAARRKLEEILHPAAQKSQNIFLQAMTAKKKNIACLEIPLLFETNAQERVNYTICVSASSGVQKDRVMKRPGMNETKFSAIVAAQMPDAEKRERSDFVVDTGGGYMHTFFQVVKILKEVKHA